MVLASFRAASDGVDWTRDRDYRGAYVSPHLRARGGGPVKHDAAEAVAVVNPAVIAKARGVAKESGRRVLDVLEETVRLEPYAFLESLGALLQYPTLTMAE